MPGIRIAGALNTAIDHNDFVREKPRDLKTVLGIFYTPAPLAEALVDWAVRQPNEIVLEPSFGGCGFLNAAARRLTQLGSPDAWTQICGCDKDHRAFKFLPQDHRAASRTRQFLQGDFLLCRPGGFSHPAFDVVLGNPPYVSRHTMTDVQIASAEAVLAELNVKLSTRASLWAYFVLHGLRFLRPGGRIAWVLPRSLTQASYGRQLLGLLETRFTSVTVISLGQRMFVGAGTDEISDVLIASGYQAGGGAGTVRRLHSESLPELLRILTPGLTDTNGPDHATVEVSGSRSVALAATQRDALNTILGLPQAVALRSLIKINIGVVTGASDFFVLRKSTLAPRGLTERDVEFLVAKFRHTEGLEVTAERTAALVAADDRVLLLKCSQRRKSERVLKYLATFAPEVREKVATFAKREPWYNLDDHQIADAFLPCLVRGAPRLVLNTARVNCTNNVLRVWFESSPAKAAKQALALALASTPGQVAAEAFGRACGSGGLKIEPCDWLRMKLLLENNVAPADVSVAFREVDALLRRQDLDAARRRADQYLRLAVPALARFAGEMDALKSALQILHNNRK